MADDEEELFDDKQYYNDSTCDVVIGTQTEKVCDVKIYKTGTTTWFNAGNTPIVIIDQTGTITNLGNTTTTGVVSGAAGVFVANMTSASVVTGPVGCTTVTAATSVQAPLGIFAALAAPYKLFDIKHPSPNQEGKRLRHGSLEGPELAVYTRGKTDGNIPLPSYWEHLIDEDSITVQLTPTSSEQNLTVTTVSKSFVQVSGSYHKPFYYMIMAERKDIPKLEIEVDAEYDYGF